MADCKFYIKGGKCNHKDAPNPGHSRCVVSVCGVQEYKVSIKEVGVSAEMVETFDHGLSISKERKEKKDYYTEAECGDCDGGIGCKQSSNPTKVMCKKCLCSKCIRGKC